MTKRLKGWLLFILALEFMVAILALIGPGDRVGPDRGDRAAIARLLVEDPTFWQTAGINFIALNVFLAAVLTAAVMVGRNRRSGATTRDN